MNLQLRITNILTKPKEEWAVIATESTDVATLFREYIVLLAAIPAIASFIGMTIVGIPAPFLGTIRIGLVSGLVHLLVGYVLTLVSYLVAAIVIEKLAPTFESRGSLLQALKMVAYASTPVWIAGVLAIYPPLGMLLLIAGIYAVYLFYLGLPYVMQTPPDKALVYTIASAVALIVTSIVIHLLTAALSGVGTLTRY